MARHSCNQDLSINQDPSMSEIMSDIRYAIRGLRQKPLFAIVAILSIAIGVGANATIFGIVNALLLRAPRGIGEASRVVEVGRNNGGHGFDTFSYPELESIAQNVRAFDRVAGTRDAPLSYAGASGAAEPVMGMAVSAPYFEVLGARPFKGRFFAASEDVAGVGTPVAVVSYSFWQHELSGRSDAVGSTIELNRHPFTVIGVTQPEFASHVPLIKTDLYIPMRAYEVARPGFSPYASWQSSWLTIVARLAPGATVDVANAQLKTQFDMLRKAHPVVYDAPAGSERSARAARLTGVPAAGHGAIAAFLSLLMAMVALVLLTTCANVAGMLIARAAGREREIAIRLALGSGRGRLIRQLVVESVVLFVVGGLIGMALTSWGLRTLATVTLPIPVTLNLDFSPDLRVFLFGFIVALATGLLFGLAPALQATRPQLVSALKNEGNAAHSRGGRLRRIFVVAQVAFSLILLISAGLFLRSLQRAARVDVGFDPAGVQMMRFDLSRDGYDEARGKEFVRALVANLRDTPGITEAAVSTDLPLDMGMSGTDTYPEGWVGPNGKGTFNASFNQVSPGYFNALGIRVVEGRALRDTDVSTGEKVVVVSEAYAAKVWPGQSAVGKRLRWSDDKSALKTVVGVVADVKNKMVMDAADPMVYVPESQEYSPGVTLLVKTRLVGAAAERAIKAQISALDRNLAITPMQSVEAASRVGTLPQRMAAAITGCLGILALILSGMGVYGVIAYMVAQRTREIGIRVAIGARQRDVVGLVVRSGLRLALPGILIGACAALGLGYVMRAFILDVPPTDIVTFSAVPAILLVMIGIATCIPAARAARVSPMTALRAE
jgi:predicted permease